MNRGVMRVVGALVIIGGLSCVAIGVGGFVLKYLLFLMISQIGGLAPSQMSIGPQGDLLLWINLLLFVPAGLGLVILGIGTMQCRKWARTLMESISALMTVAGIAGLCVSIIVVFLIPNFFRMIFQDIDLVFLDDGTVSLIVFLSGLVVVIWAGLSVVIPALLWWFYSRKSVRVLCAICDPSETWLERNPALVNALVIVNAAGVLMCLPLLVLNAADGKLVPGSALVLLSVCAVLTIAGIGLARMKLWGWLLEMFLALGFSVVGSWWVATVSTRVLLEWYLEMVGILPAVQIENGILMVTDTLAHFIIWGSSVPVIYALIKEAGRFFCKYSPPTLPRQ